MFVSTRECFLNPNELTGTQCLDFLNAVRNQNGLLYLRCFITYPVDIFTSLRRRKKTLKNVRIFRHLFCFQRFFDVDFFNVFPTHRQVCDEFSTFSTVLNTFSNVEKMTKSVENKRRSIIAFSTIFRHRKDVDIACKYRRRNFIVISKEGKR